MNLLSYNLRGSGNSVKRNRVRHLIKKHCFDVYFLQETKIQVVFEADIFKLWGSREVEWNSKGVEGRSGGFILMWKPGLFQPLFNFIGINVCWQG